MQQYAVQDLHFLGAVRLAAIDDHRTSFCHPAEVRPHLGTGIVGVIFIILHGDDGQVTALAQTLDRVDHPGEIPTRRGTA